MGLWQRLQNLFPFLNPEPRRPHDKPTIEEIVIDNEINKKEDNIFTASETSKKETLAKNRRIRDDSEYQDIVKDKKLKIEQKHQKEEILLEEEERKLQETLRRSALEGKKLEALKQELRNADELAKLQKEAIKAKQNLHGLGIDPGKVIHNDQASPDPFIQLKTPGKGSSRWKPRDW